MIENALRGGHPGSATKDRPTLRARIREVMEAVRKSSIGMSAGAWIAFGALLLSGATFAVSQSFNAGVLSARVDALAVENKQLREEAREVPVLRQRLDQEERGLAAANGRIDTYMIEIQTLREKLAEHGWTPQTRK